MTHSCVQWLRVYHKDQYFVNFFAMFVSQLVDVVHANGSGHCQNADDMQLYVHYAKVW